MKRILAVTISIVLIIYLCMFFDTNRLLKEVRSAFLWETARSETVGRPIDAYNYIRRADNDTLGKADLTLIRLFVLHNFNNGYIWTYYSYKAYDEDGELITGSSNIPTKWRIHKDNGKWEIVEIFEAP